MDPGEGMFWGVTGAIVTVGCGAAWLSALQSASEYNTKCSSCLGYFLCSLGALSISIWGFSAATEKTPWSSQNPIDFKFVSNSEDQNIIKLEPFTRWHTPFAKVSLIDKNSYLFKNNYNENYNLY